METGHCQQTTRCPALPLFAGRLTVTGNEDRDDETVLFARVSGVRALSAAVTYDTDDTSHNDRDGTLHHEVWPEDGHGGDSDARLGGAVAVWWSGIRHGRCRGGSDGGRTLRRYR